mgnify:CR=1 FL=1
MSSEYINTCYKLNVVFKLMKDNTQRITKDKVRELEENLEKLQRQEITYKEYFENSFIKWDSPKEEKILSTKYHNELLFDRLFEKYLQTNNSAEFIKYYNILLEREQDIKMADYIKIYVYNLTCQSPLKYELGFL